MNYPIYALSEIADITMGQSPPGETYNTLKIGLPFFQGKAEFGDTSPTPVKWCSKPTRIAEAGDILLSVRAPVGPTNIALERCCIGRGLAAIRAKTDIALTRYLLYYFRKFEAEIANKGVGSTFAAINKSDIERLKVSLPSLAEQERIVCLLDEAEALRKLRTQASARMDDLVPALFHEMFGGIELMHVQKKTARIGDLTQVKTGGTPSRKEPKYYMGNISWVKTTEVNQSIITETEEMITEEGLNNSNCEVFPIGTILVAMYGQGATRGRTGKLGIPASSNQACAAILPSDKFDSDYLWAFLQMSYHEIRNLGRGGNQPNLNLSMIKNYVVPLPSLSLQQEFARRVQEARQIQSRQARSAERIEALYQSMLSRAFAGEL